MAIRELELAHVQEELEDIKARLTRLESRHGRRAKRDQNQLQHIPPKSLAEMNRTELMAWLTDEGLIREPTEEERRLAAEWSAEWNAMSEDERQAIQWELDHLPAGPMVSDIVSEGRRTIWDSTTSTPAL
jgi:hypothetical protein